MILRCKYYCIRKLHQFPRENCSRMTIYLAKLRFAGTMFGPTQVWFSRPASLRLMENGQVWRWPPCHSAGSNIYTVAGFLHQLKTVAYSMILCFKVSTIAG